MQVISQYSIFPSKFVDGGIAHLPMHVAACNKAVAMNASARRRVVHAEGFQESDMPC